MKHTPRLGELFGVQVVRHEGYLNYEFLYSPTVHRFAARTTDRFPERKEEGGGGAAAGALSVMKVRRRKNHRTSETFIFARR